MEDNIMIENFINQIREYIKYWDCQPNLTCKRKMEGLTHSILCMLDGVSGGFDGDIDRLAYYSKGVMLHDELYKKDKD